jgi:predicted NAD/FAD-binding protein
MTLARERIAVVGGGVAGIVASHVLSNRHEVTLFEASDRLGGHAWSVPVHEGSRTMEVDVAFLIFNSHSYPRFLNFIEQLGLTDRVRSTDMSIGISDPSKNLIYAVNAGPRALFHQKRNLWSAPFLKMLKEIRRFRSTTDLEKIRSQSRGRSLEGFLKAEGYSDFFAENFVYPLGASVWSLPRAEMPRFPAELFFVFFSNHRLLKREKGASWQTIVGGSGQYVRRFRERFAGKIRLSSPVLSIERGPGPSTLRLGNGECESFDRVVIATQADQALRMLERPSDLEQRLLGAWRYQDCRASLHTDASIFPQIGGTWPSWNISTQRALRDPSFQLTYYLNRIQHLDAEKNYFVTLGEKQPEARHRLQDFHCRHPIFGLDCLASQPELPRLNQERTFFCGSYFGNGFHEDAVASALRVNSHFGHLGRSEMEP